MSAFTPSYIKLYESGVLKERIDRLNEMLKSCVVCPWKCKVDRTAGKIGRCRVGALPRVASHHPHFGEEPPLVGRGGSGTIFLAFCNMRCIFCQNYDISHLGTGKEVSIEELSDMMVELKEAGCHNINFVTPTHQIPQIVAALPRAIEKGLDLPLVYNCGGYESVETLKLLDGIFDIYMPDIKYGDNTMARKYSGVPNYWDVVREAVKEMHRQVGDLVVDEYGIARRGLIIRHLVLPEGVAGTPSVMQFIATEISKNSYVNIMDQYYPCYKAEPPLHRRITEEEFREAIEVAKGMGITRLCGITE